jgi:rod shape-determining protein MreC
MENLMGRYRNVTILAAAIFLQLVGLAVQVKRATENQSTRLIRVWAVGIVTPLERGVVRLETSASDIWHNYFYLRGVRQQNRELQQQLQQLELEQVRLRQDAEQARRLQALLGFKEQFIDKTLAAQVIATSGSEQSRTVYLDKGSDDGVALDMAVISKDGIVGKLSQVFRHTSQLLLINDQASGVGTILEQSRLQGVLKGRPNGEVVLDKIMSDEDVKMGDRVLTSGGDQIYPKGLPVGTVAKVTRGTEFLQVTVKPASTLNHLEEVLIIIKKAEREPAVSTTGVPQRAADILAQRLPTVPDTPPPTATGTGAAKPAAAGGAAAGSGPGLKPLTNAPAASGTSTAGNKPLSSPSSNAPLQPGNAAKLSPRMVPPGAQLGSGTGAANPAGNPPASTRVSSTASQTGTQTSAGSGVPEAPLAATPITLKNGTAPGGARQNPASGSSVDTSGNVTVPKPAAAPAQPKAVKPGAPASKPVANPRQEPPPSTNSTEAPQ